MYHTVIPVLNLRLDLQQRIECADGFGIEPLPEWVRTDSILKDLNTWDQRRVADAQLALTATYDAVALGDPDPDWKGTAPRAVQDAKYEAGVMANLALWIAKPSPAGFTVVIHGPDHSTGPLAQRASTHSPLLCHPRHNLSQVEVSDVLEAARLHRGLVEVIKTFRDGSLWTVARSVWAGLQMNILPVRCALFWVALEALF